MIFEIMRRNLQDDHVIAGLVDRVDHDPNPVLRAYATRAYGSLAPGEDVSGRLEVVAKEDEALDVRWNAQVPALAQLEGYGPGWLKTIENQWWRPGRTSFACTWAAGQQPPRCRRPWWSESRLRPPAAA